MNERDNFIVEDLDDFHVIIKADEEYRVRKQLELEVCCRFKPLSFTMELTFLSVGEKHVQFGMIIICVHISQKFACDATNPNSFSHPCTPATSSLSSEGT